MIFGNENAEVDPLVLECYVDNMSNGSQIITGRWGVGKTAFMFHATQKMAAILGKSHREHKKLWYVSESDLDSDQIVEAYSVLDEKRFKRYLKTIWKAEIYRRATIVISALKGHYGEKAKGQHWKEIQAIAATSAAGKSIWKQLPAALSLLNLIDSNKKEDLASIQSGMKEVFGERLQALVQNCLRDIEGEKIVPLIAIEPIETPFSDLEENSLAQEVISELINVFQQEFQPDENQLLDIIISVPWQRFAHNAEVNLPQKIRQYVEFVQWTKESLKVFIENRIQWEFKRVGRQHSSRLGSSWGALFEPSVHNDYPRISFNEDSFSYVLRHTNYRPREVQRIARKAVEVCAERTGRSHDDILKGIGGIRVSGSHIRAAVMDYVDGTARDRKSESYRRFRKLEEVISNLKGLTIPCNPEEISERFPSSIKSQDAFSWLWQSGMLGLEATCEKKQIENMKQILPERSMKRNIDIRHNEYIRWYFFEYNTSGDYFEIFDQYSRLEALTLKCTFHPLMFEDFAAHVDDNWPVGI
jgi:hypothetical protein